MENNEILWNKKKNYSNSLAFVLHFSSLNTGINLPKTKTVQFRE